MANEKKVRIVIIGAGKMANMVHYPAFASFDDIEIAAVIELDEERLNATCDRYGIPQSARVVARGPSDYQATIERTKPDGVYAIGQPDVMYPIWVWCLQNGYSLYIEKPLALTMHQARVLAHLAAEHKVITQVSHQRRSAPIMTQVRNRLLEQGPIVHGVVEFIKHEPNPVYGARDKMMDDGTHAVDTARWLCGGEVVRIESHMKRVETPDLNWLGATLHFDNGSTCFVICSWNSGRRVFRVQMHVPGAYADVELEGEARVYVKGNYAGEVSTTQQLANHSENYVFGGFRQKSREFIDSLKSGVDQCSSPFSDTVKTMEVCHSILAQAQIEGVA